jgi:hypothetical protein
LVVLVLVLVLVLNFLWNFEDEDENEEEVLLGIYGLACNHPHLLARAGFINVG